MTSINVDDKYCTSEKLGGGQKNNIIIWSFLIHKSSWTLYGRSLGTRSPWRTLNPNVGKPKYIDYLLINDQ